MMHPPSALQEAVLDFVQEKYGNAFIEAVAGAGKTTTLLHILTRLAKIAPHARVAMMAFNVSIKDEIVSKIAQAQANGIPIPGALKVNTCHGFGLGCCFKLLGGKPTIQSDKKQKIFKNTWDDETVAVFSSFVCRLVSFAQNEGIGAIKESTYEAWLHLVNHHDLEIGGEDVSWEEEETLIDRAIDMARKLLTDSVKEAMEHKVIDFDDMIFLPVLKRCYTRPYDYILPDESQDLSPTRIALICGMMGRNSRLFAVGDRYQAIYGFSGAGVDSVEQIINLFNCEVLPLNVCYRCDTSIIEEAQKIVPHIEAAPGKPSGKIETGTAENFKWETLEPTDAILCRYTAPLLKTAYKLIGLSIPCTVVGRDIGEGLIKLIKKMRAKDIPELEVTLNEYYEREVEKLKKMDSAEGKIESLTDRVEAVRACIDALPEDDLTITRLLQNINSLFSDDEIKGRVTLSSVHRAKGREWPKVIILARSQMPSRRAKVAWQHQQEMNLIYVAVTRAEHHLILLD